MAEFPGSSRVSTDYTAGTTAVYCLEPGCDWTKQWNGTSVEEAVIARALRTHHKTTHGKDHA